MRQFWILMCLRIFERSVFVGGVFVQHGCRWRTQRHWVWLGRPLESREEVFGKTWPIYSPRFWAQHWGNALLTFVWFSNNCKSGSLYIDIVLNTLGWSLLTGMLLLYQSLQFLLKTCQILVIGAGGLGCELLKNLVGEELNLDYVYWT